MLIDYEKTIPYPFDIVLSQYFDYEHIEHVHPDTLGEYRVVENNGNEIVYEQLWPGRFWRRRSWVKQTFDPPGDIHFEFVKGLHKGVVVETHLEPSTGGTLIQESYIIPSLPDWDWLKPWVRPSVMKSVNRIWDEDLAVDVCFDGWPGVPGSSPPQERPEPQPVLEDRWIAVCREEDISPESMMEKSVRGIDLALIRIRDEISALEAKCPHAGGPLALGLCRDGVVACPWHGARFEVDSGKRKSGPVNRDLKTYPARFRDGMVEIHIGDHSK